MSGIGDVLSHYYPGWEEPEDYGDDWIPCLCPFHGESNASASISPDRGAFRCHGCGETGDVISIIRKKEGVTYQEAIGRYEELSPGGDASVFVKSPRKSGGRVAGGTRTSPSAGNRTVRSRVRG